MNALQSYSSDENSGDEGYEDKPVIRNKPSKGGGGGDHGTNYDDVGMDISEEESAEEESSSATSGRTAAANGESTHRPSMRGRANSDGCMGPDRNKKDSSPRVGGQSQEADKNSATARQHSLTEAEEILPDPNKKDEDKQYSSLQERLLGLASGKLPEPTTGEGAVKAGGARRLEDRRRSRSPRDRHTKSRRSRSPARRRRSRSRDKRSKSRDRRSKSRERRSRSRDRRSKSRDRRSRSRSRDRRDRRRRSRSRDRRRDHKKDAASKAGLLPLPASAGSAPLLSTPPAIPSLPAYYNPGSVNAAKYAEQERKKKLLWGNKGAAASSEGTTAGGVPGAGAVGGLGRGLLVNNHAALLNLARANPGGRELNLGLGKNQFNVGGAAKNTPVPSGASSSGGTGGGMSDLWSTTTFSNDSDGKMAEKFKRLMGVKDSAGVQNKAGGGGPGAKLNEVQEDMFSNMERQYEVARLATHTHKGYGLGFTSTAYLPK